MVSLHSGSTVWTSPPQIASPCSSELIIIVCSTAWLANHASPLKSNTDIWEDLTNNLVPGMHENNYPFNPRKQKHSIFVDAVKDVLRPKHSQALYTLKGFCWSCNFLSYDSPDLPEIPSYPRDRKRDRKRGLEETSSCWLLGWDLSHLALSIDMKSWAGPSGLYLHSVGRNCNIIYLNSCRYLL